MHHPGTPFQDYWKTHLLGKHTQTPFLLNTPKLKHSFSSLPWNIACGRMKNRPYPCHCDAKNINYTKVSSTSITPWNWIQNSSFVVSDFWFSTHKSFIQEFEANFGELNQLCQIHGMKSLDQCWVNPPRPPLFARFVKVRTLAPCANPLTPPKMNECHLKRDELSIGKYIWTNHQFSDMNVSFQGGHSFPGWTSGPCASMGLT